MGNCVDCGFLASRNFISRQLEETEKVTREKGKRADYLRNSGDQAFYQMVHEPPICLKQAFNLWDEAGITNPSSDGSEIEQMIASIINSDRQCKEWTSWKQGLSPKEHQDILDREERNGFEEVKRRNDRKWHWIELAAIVLGTGLFTLLGAWIARLN